MSNPITYQGNLWNREPFSKPIQLASYKTQTYGLALVKSRTPVDTDTMRPAWQANLVGNGINWLNPVPYSGYVEFGTRKMLGRFPMTRSLPQIQDYFQSQLSNYIEVYNR